MLCLLNDATYTTHICQSDFPLRNFISCGSVLLEFLKIVIVMPAKTKKSNFLEDRNKLSSETISISGWRMQIHTAVKFGCICANLCPGFQWSLNYPFWGNQTIQIYGNFEGFPLKQCIVWVGDIMTPQFFQGA